jgi:hypothetical protein
MLTQINGRDYMTGTSEGSLYPVVLQHPGGITVGARLELKKTDKPEHVLLGIYARVEKYAGENRVAMSTEELFAALPHMHFRIAGPLHISGSLGGGVYAFDPLADAAKRAQQLGKVFHKSIVSLATKFNLTHASDADLQFFGEEAYMSKLGGHVEEAKIEQQLGGTFDFQTLLSKPGASDPK